MTAAFDPGERSSTTMLAEQRTAYLTRLRAQLAATMGANDPLTEYLTTLIQQIAMEAWDAGYQTGQAAT